MSILEEICLESVNFDKVKTYNIMGTVVPGAEEVIENYIKNILGGYEYIGSLRGKVFFSTVSSLRQLLMLKCFDNLYYYMGRYKIGKTKNCLIDFQHELCSIQYDQLLAPLFNPIGKKRIHVSVSRLGKHSYTRFDVAEVVMKALTSLKIFDMGDADNHDLHFRLDIINEDVYLSLKITSSVYRYRYKSKMFMPGAIRPSIANSLVFLSDPGKNDIFLDPFCGSGTIVSERARYPHRKILAFDINEEAVESSKYNAPCQVIVRKGDACHLPINNNSVDVIVTNLPWDVQIHSDDIQKLYYSFLEESIRVLKKDGRMILLTDKTNVLLQVAATLQLNIVQIAQLSLHGLHPCIYSIKL